MSVSLSPLQLDAAKSVSGWFRGTSPGDASRFYLAGYAGTGKSTILPTIIDYCNLDPAEVAFCAPTGKAAKVMTTKLRSQFGDLLPARTIHSLIYTPRGKLVEALESKLDALRSLRINIEEGVAQDGAMESFGFSSERDLDKEIAKTQNDLDDAYLDKDGPKFTLNVESTIRNSRLIVVDEASMVGSSIAKDLLTFGVPVLAIGDPGQLPPVGDEEGLTAGRPDFFLTEIHRQAQDNPIIWLATLARQGKRLPLGDHGDGVKVVTRKNDDRTLDVDSDLQVICGTNRKRWQLTKKIRKACGYDETGPVVGEPLIVCKNSRRIPELVNGAFVTVVKSPGDLIEGNAYFAMTVDDDQGVPRHLSVYQGLFEEHHLRDKGGFSADPRDAYKAKQQCEHLDWGWAITCHKSQGSQWDEVVVHDESDVFRDDKAKWAYTAITRAAKKLTVVVD